MGWDESASLCDTVRVRSGYEGADEYYTKEGWEIIILASYAP